MNVNELIEVLKKMDGKAEVRHLWDGELRTTIEHVYMGKTGLCVTADDCQVAYADEARPIGSPSKREDNTWHTPMST